MLPRTWRFPKLPCTVILRSALGLVSETLWLPEESICLLPITLLAVTATALAAVSYRPPPTGRGRAGEDAGWVRDRSDDIFGVNSTQRCRIARSYLWLFKFPYRRIREIGVCVPWLR